MISAYFFKTFNELCGNFSLVWTKIQIVENFEKIFEKFSKCFLGKLLQTHYFIMLSKNLINNAFVFRVLGEKQFVGMFWEKLPKNIAKMHCFCIFFKKLKNPALIFCAFKPKTQSLWNFEKVLMKILLKNWISILFLILFFENLLLKIEPSEITFSTRFFRFRGGFPTYRSGYALGEGHFSHVNIYFFP